LGDLYEGLLERTTSERKSKAGQYFTPRPLIAAIIHLMKPKVGEVIQDPAAGTGGFLIAAHRAIMRDTDDLTTVSKDVTFAQRNGKYQGAELITGTHRLNTMNLLLHGIDQPIDPIDVLTSDAKKFDPADLILTNPPFDKFPESVARDDFVVTAEARNHAIFRSEHTGHRRGVCHGTWESWASDAPSARRCARNIAPAIASFSCGEAMNYFKINWLCGMIQWDRRTTLSHHHAGRRCIPIIHENVRCPL